MKNSVILSMTTRINGPITAVMVIHRRPCIPVMGIWKLIFQEIVMVNSNHRLSRNIKLLMADLKRVYAAPTENKLILAVANYIQQNLSSSIKVEDIAESLYMSRPYLFKKFKKETGISVSDFIHIQKIEEAKRLLKYTDKSLLSIPIYLSYSSQSHFTNMFKKITGQLPKTYREEAS